MDDEKRKQLTALLQALAKPEPETDAAAIEADERKLLAIVTDKTADRAARAKALDELTEHEREGRLHDKALGMAEGTFSLTLFAEAVQAAIDLVDNEGIFEKPGWEQDPLASSALNFIAVAGGNIPGFPAREHSKLVDKIFKAHGAVKSRFGREPS